MSDFLPPYSPIICSQGDYVGDPAVWKEPGSCAAHAISYLKEVQEYKFRGISYCRFDYVWIYGNRASGDWQGEGLVTMEALDKMSVDGVPRLDEERAYKNTYTTNLDPDNYDSGHLTAKDYAANYRSQLLAEAQTRKTSASYLEGGKDLAINTIKSAIQDNGGILVEFYATDDLFNATNNSGIMTDIYNTYTSVHEMCIIGWKNINGTDYWICPNSWGNWSGDYGTFYMPFGYSQVIWYYIVPETTPSSPTRPSNFSWSNTITSGGDVNITAIDWNTFAYRVNLFRFYKGLNVYQYPGAVRSGFIPAVTGNDIQAIMFNELVNAINDMSPPTSPPTTKNVGNDMYASYFNDIVTSLNSIT